jgi:hypothetical protein
MFERSEFAHDPAQAEQRKVPRRGTLHGSPYFSLAKQRKVSRPRDETPENPKTQASPSNRPQQESKPA